ncbi:MAG: hypothetical protein IT331_07315 [Anaerolineae bacterium]|nr:hypothetical protein [Anaerolineae bacterium]
MMLDSLVLEIRQLPLLTRLALVEIIAESVRQELAQVSEPVMADSLTRGMLRPEERIPSDEELQDDYINYLIQKYK